MNEWIIKCRRTVVIMLGIFLSIASHTALAKNESTEHYTELYVRWHNALDHDRLLTEPMLFRIDHVSQELADVNMAIQKNRIGMAMFLCEKMAAAKYLGAPMNINNRLYRDVHLLREVAGIDLIFADDKPSIDQDIAGNILNFTAQFQKEWHEGVFHDPSQKIGQLCQARYVKEADENIEPNDLEAIRRYGIFGLPELIRQIKTHNSKHAFAAYLIITGNPVDYGEYILQSNHQFASKEDKLRHVKIKVHEMNTGNDSDREVVKKISTALSE